MDKNPVSHFLTLRSHNGGRSQAFVGWARLAGLSMFVGPRSRVGQGHTDSLGCTRAQACGRTHARTHTHTLVLCSVVLPSPSRNMTHFPRSGCAGPAQPLCPSLEQAGPRSFLACAQEPHPQHLSWSLWGLRSGWKGDASSQGPRAFREARDPPKGLEAAAASLASEKGGRSPDREGRAVFSGPAEQIFLSPKLEICTKGSSVTAEQIVCSLVACLLLPGPVPGPSCPLEPTDAVMLLTSFPTLDSEALGGKIKSPSTLLNFF